MRGARPESCPECGSERVVPIVYGLPTDEALEMAEQGRFRLGGCCVTGNDPKWGCLDCAWPFTEEE
ncbi:MAG: hypothetical protein ACYTDY_00290 [Planctomycetota bacterium]